MAGKKKSCRAKKAVGRRRREQRQAQRQAEARAETDRQGSIPFADDDFFGSDSSSDAAAIATPVKKLPTQTAEVAKANNCVTVSEVNAAECVVLNVKEILKVYTRKELKQSTPSKPLAQLLILFHEHRPALKLCDIVSTFKNTKGVRKCIAKVSGEWTRMKDIETLCKMLVLCLITDEELLNLEANAVSQDKKFTPTQEEVTTTISGVPNKASSETRLGQLASNFMDDADNVVKKFSVDQFRTLKEVCGKRTTLFCGIVDSYLLHYLIALKVFE